MSKDVFGDEIISEETVIVESSENINIDAEPISDPEVSEDSTDNITEPEKIVEESESKVENTIVENTSVENDASRNFTAMRNSKRELEAQLAEQAKQIHAFENARKQQQAEDSDTYLDDDEKKQKTFEQQQLNVQKMYNQTQQMQAEILLKQKYNDFDDVVSVDNVDVLKALYPKAAYAIINETDVFVKAEKAYKAMKKYNIFTSDQNPTVNASNKKRVIKNVAKPRPVSSIKAGSPALGAANSFAGDSPAERLRTFEEMKRLASGG